MTYYLTLVTHRSKNLITHVQRYVTFMPASGFHMHTTEVVEQGHRVLRILRAASCENFDNLGDLLEQEGQLPVVHFHGYVGVGRGCCGATKKELKGKGARPQLLASTWRITALLFNVSCFYHI